MELSSGGSSIDWFFLAMAHWQLGQKDEARTWFDKSIRSMDKNQPQNDLNQRQIEDLRRFRAEAAGLLGITGPQLSTEAEAKR